MIDARIPMMGKSPNVMGSLAQGLGVGQAIQQMPYQNALLQSKVQNAEDVNTMNRQKIDANDQAVVNAAGAFAYQGLSAISQLPPEQQEIAFNQFAQQMDQQGFIDALGLDRNTIGSVLNSPQEMQSVIASLEPFEATASNQQPFQKGASGLVKDSQNNMFHTSNVFDPTTGANTPQLTPVDPSGPAAPVGGISPVNASGLTMPEQIDLNATKETDKQQIAIRQGAAKDAFESIGKANKAIANIDEAIKAIDDGANTGPVSQWFPSFKTSTIELQNAANRMGLDIIGAVTFGALSAGEMQLAMSTAMPQGMDEPELKKWLVKRKKAQHKLRAEMMKAAQHFEANGSISDYIESMKVDGEYISRADLPMITEQAGYDALEKGDYFLEQDENGVIKSYRK